MIRAIITDFDGTLVDTFEANYRAYKKAFESVGIDLKREKYRECFGYRYDSFMQAMGVYDGSIAQAIKDFKMNCYPEYFQYLKPNKALINLIAAFKDMGGRTAIASTARKENLMNVVNFLGIAGYFDLIYAGADVQNGKPNPEIYTKSMEALRVIPKETIIFEDSHVGIAAAKASGASYMIVSEKQFE